EVVFERLHGELSRLGAKINVFIRGVEAQHMSVREEPGEYATDPTDHWTLIKHRVSSIQHRASSIVHPASLAHRRQRRRERASRPEVQEARVGGARLRFPA